MKASGNKLPPTLRITWCQASVIFSVVTLAAGKVWSKRPAVVDDELHFWLAFGGAHGVPVVGDDALRDAAPSEQIVVFVAFEVQSVAGGELSWAPGRVVVDRESPKVAALGVGVEGLEEPRSPIDVVAIRADRHEAERSLAVLGVHAV
jgi:hypothetical protein